MTTILYCTSRIAEFERLLDEDVIDIKRLKKLAFEGKFLEAPPPF